MAAPFVQGQLRKEYLSVDIETECGHCGRAMHLTVDSELKFTVRDPGAELLVFEPEVDWTTFNEPSIINAY